MSTNKEFEKRWNNFCRKVKFICCCGCELDDPELEQPLPPKIQVARLKGQRRSTD